MAQARNIVLVGFMGSGKTCVGQCLALRLGASFVDMDARIVARQGKSIPKIFEQDGEPFFRRCERELVAELAAQSGLVIATGGGIVLNPANIADFSRAGLVVRLVVSPEDVLARVGNDANRPLLAGQDKMARILTLMEARRALYEAIPQRVDTSGLTVEQVAERVLELYRA